MRWMRAPRALRQQESEAGSCSYAASSEIVPQRERDVVAVVVVDHDVRAVTRVGDLRARAQVALDAPYQTERRFIEPIVARGREDEVLAVIVAPLRGDRGVRIPRRREVVLA